MRRVLAAVDRALARIELGICLLALVAIVVATSLGVFFRYGLNSPLMWSNELGMLALLWLTFIGAALVYREHGHIAVEVLRERLPPRAQQWLGAAIVVMIALAVAIVGWKMLTLIPLQHQKMISALGIPRSVYGIPVLWMSVSMVVTSLRDLAAMRWHMDTGTGATG